MPQSYPLNAQHYPLIRNNNLRYHLLTIGKFDFRNLAEKKLSLLFFRKIRVDPFHIYEHTLIS